MLNNLYSEAITEVLDILNHTKNEDKEKIPPSFMTFLETNKSKNYIPKLDHSKSIKCMELKPKTLALLGLIYIKYWANEEEKENFINKAKENEKHFLEQQRINYNPNNIFKDTEKIFVQNNKNKELPEIVKDENNLFIKFWKKIKKIIRI